MDNAATPGRRLKRAAAGFALWTLFGILWSMPSILEVDTSHDGRTLWEAADHVIVFYWAWALVTPLVLMVARRASRLAGSRIRMGLLIALGALVVILAQASVYSVLDSTLTSATFSGVGGLSRHLARHVGGDLATYLTLIGVYLLLDANRRARDNEIALSRADLELLRWQLQPHFLFNALNTVSTLVLKAELEDANRAIELISRYLREALTQRSDAMVTLENELVTVQRYLDIERLRFGNTLSLDTDASAEALRAILPGSLLQPLVENAVRHGVASGQEGGTVTIAARVTGSRLHVTVSDPGRDAAPAGPPTGADPGGFGLRYVKERLRQHYGTEGGFSLTVAARGTVAALDIPQAAS